MTLDGKDVFVHPKALVETSLDLIGQDTRIWAFAHIMKDVRIGKNCNIGDHVFIESGVTLGDNVTVKNGVALYKGVIVKDNVFIGPNAVFTNDYIPRPMNKTPEASFKFTLLKEGATIGANATIICGVSIGQHSFVGAGSVVTRDVNDHVLVYGNPAKAKSWICSCGGEMFLSNHNTMELQCSFGNCRKTLWMDTSGKWNQK